MFNLTEAVRARYLIENVLLGGSRHCYPTSPTSTTSSSSEEDTTWASIAVRIVILGFVYGTFFALKKRFSPEKKDALVSARWPLQRKTKDGDRDSGSEEEVCPICLDPPRSGVRAGCGHRMCSRCLRSYCESHLNKRRRPPPCPLCRTPLVSVTLTYDQINLLSSDCGTDCCTVDPATAKWIRRYNANRGVVDNDESCFLVKNTMTVLKLLLASLFIGIIARFQNSYGIDLVAYSTYLVTVFGLILIMCLWFKSKEQVEYEANEF